MIIIIIIIIIIVIKIKIIITTIIMGITLLQLHKKLLSLLPIKKTTSKMTMKKLLSVCLTAPSGE